MSNIIVCLYSGINKQDKIPPYHEGFINCLKKDGHNVLVILTNYFNVLAHNSNELHFSIDKEKVDDYVINFDPDYIFTFNNALYKNLINLTNCPIGLIAADSPPLFLDKELIKNNIDRYTFLHFSEHTFKSAQEIYGGEIDKKHFSISYASDFKSEIKLQDINISFIGTNFIGNDSLKDYLCRNTNNIKLINQFKKLTNEFTNDPRISPQRLIDQMGLTLLNPQIVTHENMLSLLSCAHRISTLSALSDLGLRLFGTPSWYQSIDSDVNLLHAYVPINVHKVKHNQNIYNRSKISLNIAHAQAGDNSLPWRVIDVMSCNTVLVTEKKDIMKRLFSKYVDIPMYDSKYEARELCQKLLKDEQWREDIQIGSQLAIKETMTFAHQLIKLENIFNIKPSEDKNGRITYLQSYNFYKKTYKWLQNNINIFSKYLPTPILYTGKYILNTLRVHPSVIFNASDLQKLTKLYR